MMTLRRQWKTTLMMDNDVNGNTANQMTGDDADNNDADADVNTAMKTNR